jgi:hypothetical protein
VPFYSARDFAYREFEPAEKVVLHEVEQGRGRKFHHLDGALANCNRPNGFLSTVQELANRSLGNPTRPITLCYTFNSKPYTLTLDHARPVPETKVKFVLSDSKKEIERTYQDLEESQFHVLNRATGRKTYFALLLGRSGSLRGAPVQINYQPNWWFRIVLNLKPPTGDMASKH